MGDFRDDEERRVDIAREEGVCASCDETLPNDRPYDYCEKCWQPSVTLEQSPSHDFWQTLEANHAGALAVANASEGHRTYEDGFADGLLSALELWKSQRAS